MLYFRNREVKCAYLSRIIYLIVVFIFDSDNAGTGNDISLFNRGWVTETLTELLVDNFSSAGVLSGLTASYLFF